MIRIAYITNPEVGNILRDMKKDDTLLLYFSGEQNVPVGEIQAFMSTKGTVTFKEYVNDIVTAFEIGEMFSKNPSVSIIDSGIKEATEVFSTLNSYLNQKNPATRQKKPRKKKTTIATESAQQAPTQLELPLSPPSAQKTETTASTANEVKAAPSSKKKEASQPAKKESAAPAEPNEKTEKKARSTTKAKKEPGGPDTTIDPKFSNYVKSLGIDGYNDTYPAKLFSSVGFALTADIPLEGTLGSEFSAVQSKQIMKALNESSIAKLTELWREASGVAD